MLLTGGGDVNPRLYHRKPHKKVYGVSDQRDYCEWLALDWAQEKNIPVMGICRGSQIMNVWAGGTLWQDIGGHYGTFPVGSLEQTLLHEIFKGDAHVTRHLHHQAVKHVAAGFRMAAVSQDRHIEAIESMDGRCIGVQFHPEMMTLAEHSKALFRWLVCESARRAGLDEPKERTITTYGRSWKSWAVTDEEEYHYWASKNKWWEKNDKLPALPPAAEGIYQCPECDIFPFATRPGWECHLIATHKWEREQLPAAWNAVLDSLEQEIDNIFACKETGCTARFPTREEQIDHLVMVHDKQDLSELMESYHKCDFCTDTDVGNPLHTMPTGTRVCDGCVAVMEGAT